VASEAAKVVVSGVLGGIKDLVARKLAHRHKGDLAALLADHAQLAVAIRDAGEADPQFATRIDALVASQSATGDGCSDVPGAPEHFVNRDTARAQLSKPGVHVISGPRGSGKSALVYRVAKELSGRYPDGQIYVNLSDWRAGAGLRRSEIAAHVLGRLGVEANLVTMSTAELWAQYRSVLARRRLLLALDNAESLADVRDLVPTSSSSLVLVTAIKPEDDLLAEFPSQISIGTLDPVNAMALLERVATQVAVAAEKAAAVELVELCDRMPFAVLQAGVRVRRRLLRGPGAIASVLADFRRTGVLGGVDVIAAAFEQTFGELSPDAAELCLLLASHPGPDFTTASACALFRRPVDDALDELAAAGFLIPTGSPRQKLYNLVREGARRRGPRDEAIDRALTYYRDQSVAADYSLGMDRLRCHQPLPGVTADFGGRPVLDWVESELEAYGALAREAYLRGRDVELGQICGALEILMINRGHYRLFVEINRWGIKSAQRLGNQALEVRILSQQGRAYFLLHEFSRALPLLERAMSLVKGLENPALESSVLEFFARFHEEQCMFPPAFDLMNQAVGLDLAMGETARRALSLHTRMLANILVKMGSYDDALSLLTESAAITHEPRNLARVLTVRAKALTGLGVFDEAEQALQQAWYLAADARATQYTTEFNESFGDLAAARGDFATAEWLWQQAWQTFWTAGHPREVELREKLTRLRSR
jgi:tetratricopeptide (TPR) repeat protein